MNNEGDTNKGVSKRKGKPNDGTGDDHSRTRPTLVENEPHWGDQIDTTSPACRFVFQNVNSLGTSISTSKLHDVCANADIFNAQVVGLAETNINWQYRTIQNDTDMLLKQHFQHFKRGVSSANWGKEDRSQPGGTMTLVVHPWASRTTMAADTSGMGRWTEATIMGRESRQVTVFTVYRVCQKTGPTGNTTAYAQQWHAMTRMGVANPDPRKKVLQDLYGRIVQLKAAGHEIVVMIDANDTLEINSQFARWAKALDLVDAVATDHGVVGEPATYSRGTKRLDYILVSARIQEYVMASGILPLEEFCDSDHRAVFIDVDLNGYLKGAPSPMAMILRRGLISGDPRAVTRYLKGVNEFWLDSNILEKARQIRDEVQPGEAANDDQRARMDEVDRMFGESRLASEATCRKIVSHPWSPELDLAKRKLRYWRLWIKQKRQYRDFSKKRSQVWKEAPALDQEPTWKNVTEGIATARKGVREAIRNAASLREKHLEERAEFAAGKGKAAVAKEIRLLQRIEAQRKMARRIQRLLGRGNKGAMSHIIVTEPDGTTRRVTDQAEINRLLLARNKKHFSQADGTPFTTEPLVDFFGKYGTNDASEILLGEGVTPDTMDLDEATRCILSNLKRLSNELIDVHITAEDLMEGYGVWNEMTSTSPSGLHLGHDKALLKPKRHRKKKKEGNDEDDDDPYEQLRQEIFELKAILLNFAIQHGHVYTRWKTVVNAMIEKIPGRPLIEKLRVIHLIESDFNLMIGILWGRRLMKQAEKLNALGCEQWGSRASKSAVQALADKHLNYSIARLARMNFATVDNDAKSCYDRIVMVFASLCSQRMGMDPKACEIFLKTLELAQYHVKTQLGISEESYCTTESATIHGPGQGGRGSPSVWILISCLIMECLQKHSTGMEISDPKLEMILKQYSTGFVDDVTLWIGNLRRSLEGAESPEMVLQEAARAAQWWENLLYTTGGKLELQKCFAYLVFWVFDEEGRPRLMEPDEFPFDIVIRDSQSGEEVSLDTKCSYDSHKTLGAMENPDGNYQAEHERLKQKSDGMARQVFTACMSATEAQQIYQTIWRPGMSYSLPVGTLTCEKAREVQSAMTRAVLQATGYNEHTPSEIVFGPIELGGIGMTHLFAEQGTLQTKMVLQELRGGTPIGQKIRLLLQWAQIVAGVELPILEHPNGWLPQLDDEAFLHTMREFLDKSGLGIRIDGISCPSPKRVNDLVLMDTLMGDQNQSRFSDEDVHSINRVRMYLRVETLSDITNAEGTEIRQTKWEANKDARRKDAGLWPNLAPPGPKTKKTWQRFLGTMCKYQSRELGTHLGEWTKPPHTSDFRAWIHRANKTVAVRDNDQWAIFGSKSALRRGRAIGERLSETNDIDTEIWCPADISTLPKFGIVATAHQGWNRHMKITKEQTAPTPWHKALLKNMQFKHPPQVMGSILRDEYQTIVIASDGGAKDNKGTFAWTMSCNRHIIVDGLGKAWGEPMSSYRAEAFGKMAWLALLKRYVENGNELKCKIESYCDNKGLVSSTDYYEGQARWTAPMCPDFDVIHEINATQKFLLDHGVRLEATRHVKGHQDTTTRRVDLTWEAELNIRTDKLATKARGPKYPQPVDVTFPGGKVCLTSDGAPRYSKEITTLQWKWRNYELKDYYCSRFRIPLKVLESINWPGYAGARRRLTRAEAKFSTKFLIGWLPVGTRLVRQGGSICNCHRCDAPETCDHVMQCPNLSEDNTKLLRDFVDELRSHQTTEEVTIALHHGLTMWLHDLGSAITHPVETVPRGAAVAYQAQTRIGWRLLSRGLLADEWSRIQEHSVPRSERTEGDTWNAKISAWLVRRFQARWKQRNSETMGPTDTARDFTSRQEKEAKARVIYLYSRELEISAFQRAMIFNIPLQDRIQQPLMTLQKWLLMNEQTVQLCAKQYQEKLKTGQRDIRTMLRANGRRKSTNSIAPMARIKEATRTVQAAVTKFFQTQPKQATAQQPTTNQVNNTEAPTNGIAKGGRRILRAGKQLAITLFGRRQQQNHGDDDTTMP